MMMMAECAERVHSAGGTVVAAVCRVVSTLLAQTRYSRHVRRRRRQEFISGRRREGRAGFIGVGAGALVQAVGAEAFPRANAAVGNPENETVASEVTKGSPLARLGRVTQAAPRGNSSLFNRGVFSGQCSVNPPPPLRWCDKT